MKTLIQGGYVVAFDGQGHRVIRDGVVVYEDDHILFVGKSFPGEVDQTIEARGRQLVSPGFIDCEAVAAVDIQGFATDIGRKDMFGPAAWNYASTRKRLRELWEEDNWDEAALGAEFGAAAELKGGSTTLVATATALEQEGREEPTVEAIGRLGGRAYMGRPYQSASYYVDEGGHPHYHWWDEERVNGQMEKSKAFVARYEGAYGGRIRTMLFPYRLDACTPELLRASRAAARDLNVPIRLHVTQFLLEFYEILRRHGRTPIEYLADLDFMGPGVLLHHCIFTSDHSWLAYPKGGDDLKLLADSGATVSHSPVIFARRAVGLESLHRYLQAGVRMAMATDTFPPDLFMSMRWAANLCKMAERNVNTGTATELYNMATLGGARALGRDDLGRLAPGAKADIAIIDLDKWHIGPIDDPIRSLIHYANMDDVSTVIVDGKVVVREGRVLALSRSEQELFEGVQKIGRKMKEGISARDWANRTPEQIFPPSFPIE